jgi:hypothetical protein
MIAANIPQLIVSSKNIETGVRLRSLPAAMNDIRNGANLFVDTRSEAKTVNHNPQCQPGK